MNQHYHPCARRAVGIPPFNYLQLSGSKPNDPPLIALAERIRTLSSFAASFAGKVVEYVWLWKDAWTWVLILGSKLLNLTIYGGFNPSENMLVKLDSISPIFGVKIPKIFELPPPSISFEQKRELFKPSNRWVPTCNGPKGWGFQTAKNIDPIFFRCMFPPWAPHNLHV